LTPESFTCLCCAHRTISRNAGSPWIIAVLCTSGSAGTWAEAGTESEGCELPKSLKSSPSSVGKVTGDFAVGTNDADGTFGLASKSPMGADSFAGIANCGDERHTRRQNTTRGTHGGGRIRKDICMCRKAPTRAVPCLKLQPGHGHTPSQPTCANILTPLKIHRRPRLRRWVPLLGERALRSRCARHEENSQRLVAPRTFGDAHSGVHLKSSSSLRRRTRASMVNTK
jgi:hypothetical protein